MFRIFSIAAVLVFTFSITVFSAPKKVIVRGIPADMPLIGKSKCIAPFVCQKKDTPTLYEYNSEVWGNPKFSAGEITLRDGSVLKGEVAVLNFQADWGFVKHFALFIPEGESEAWFVGAGYAQLITKEEEKKTNFYDMYGTVYLERLVSGKIRLSYNPAAGTNKKVADFVSPELIDAVERQARGRAALAALKDGKNLNQAMKDGEDFSGAVTKVIASIEITEKEYLVYDETKRTTTLITKANYEDVLQTIFDNCAGADKAKLKSFKSYKNIEKAFEYLNSTCSN